MRKKVCGACLLAMLLVALPLLAAGARAETYTYGGSGSDCLQDIAISEDGRILLTGYTSSTDGTLASRTKSGRSGWALCVDARGEVLWSFCSRNGSEDEMRAPVFHDDGTATVLLFSRGGEKELVELIRLDASGTAISRAVLAQNVDMGNKSLMMLSPHAFAGGYVIGTQDSRNWANTYAVYDWNGQLLGAPSELPAENGIMAMSEAHAIMGIGEEIWLCAIAKDGTRTPLAKLDDHREGEMLSRRYNGMISLEDGGAVACGWIRMGEQCKGLFSRWDAEGKTVFEWVMDDVQLNDLVAADGGFVTYAFPDYSFQNMPKTLRLTLMRFDAEGIVGTRAALPEIPYGGSCRLAALPDGRIAALEAWWSDEGRMETRLVIQAVSADTEWRISGGTRDRFLLCPEDGSMQPVPDEYALLKRTDVAVNLFDGGILVRKLFDLDAAAYEAAFAWYDFADGGLSERWRVSHPTLRGLWGNEVSVCGDSLLFAGLDVLRGEEGMHGAVFLLDMADGSLRWAYRTKEAQDCTIRSAQFKDGRVYCVGNMTTGKENVPVEEAWIDVRFSLDARTGERLEDGAGG